MARKPTHEPDELRELIISEAIGLIEEHGLKGLSARAIAQKIGYSPGTIYNAFKNLDDVILTIEGRVLDQLDSHLQSVDLQARNSSPAVKMALAYYQFTQDHRNLWNVLFEHHLSTDQAPEWYQQKLEGLLGHIERVVRPLMANEPDDHVVRAARVLWAGVHGITSLAGANKLTNVTSDDAAVMVQTLVETFEAGLVSGSAIAAPELRKCG